MQDEVTNPGVYVELAPTPQEQFNAYLQQVDLMLEEAIANSVPPVGHLLRFFRFMEVSPEDFKIVLPYAVLAVTIGRDTQNAETTVALRKLLESMDAAKRARSMKAETQKPRPLVEAFVARALASVPQAS